MTDLLPALIPFFYLSVLPLGVAGQNIGLGVALLCALILIFIDGARDLKRVFGQPLVRQYVVLWGLLFLSITLSTLLVGKNKEASRFFWGYLYGGVIPLGGALLALRRTVSLKMKIPERFFVFVLSLLGVVALSQMVWGWKFESGSFVASIHRAQGFYSHPLTFAYVSLIVMPMVFARLCANLYDKFSWIVAASALSMILCSQSVTVIVLTACTGLAAVSVLLKGKSRVILLFAAMLLAGLIVATPNPFSQKIHTVFAGERGDHETDYPDDRIAFWHAHGEMFKDAPLLGHGSGLEAEDRAPYYEKIGLSGIKRMYEAHNMYLQYAVEGGVISVAAFVALLLWLIRVAWTTPDLRSWERFYLVATPIVFALGGLTQNSIQDSEVRYVFLGFIAVLFYRASSRPT